MPSSVRRLACSKSLLLLALALGCGGGGGAGNAGRADGGPAGACPALEVLPQPSNEIFVAPDGDDGAAGTSDAPLKTLAAAAGRFASAGGTIVVRGGTYPDQELEAVGTSDTPLVIRAADGETPIFDGPAVTAAWSGVIRLTTAQHVALVGLEVANCQAKPCQGIISPAAVLDLTVRGCDLHDLSGPSMRFHGKTIRLEQNHIHDVALVNVNDAAYPNGGWPTCSGTEPDPNLPDAPWADDVVIRGNDIEDCWGEGIGVWFASHALVEDNTVDNAWNVGIYLDNSYQVTITRNFVRMTQGLGGGGGTGIEMASESYAGWLNAGAASHDIAITNNVVSAGSGIDWWSSPSTTAANTYGPVQVFHNTVVAFQGSAIGFGAVAAGLPAPAPSQAENNVLFDEGGSYLGDPASWRFGSNAWINVPQPAFADPSDVSLSLTIGTFAAPTDAEPLAAEVSGGAGDTGVTVDYACNPRDSAAPTRGAYEK